MKKVESVMPVHFKNRKLDCPSRGVEVGGLESMYLNNVTMPMRLNAGFE